MLEKVGIAIGARRIVEDVSFDLQQGQIGCVLGASGSGKTTLLRGIAGLEPLVSGDISVQGRSVHSGTASIPVEKRNIGMVFQDYALFPHLTVRANIAFGLDDPRSAESRGRMERVVRMLDIEALVERYPHQISGGQQQRVAIARALAPGPGILLLDEPFASLDVELREQIALEIRRVLKDEGITTVLVTHNQHEAFAMADEIGVMRAGRLQQWDTAFNLYHRPVDRYVADFVGEGAFVPGRIVDGFGVETEFGILRTEQPHGFEEGCKVDVLVRPDDVVANPDSELRATVVAKAFRGAEYLYGLKLPSGAEFLCLLPSHTDHPLGAAVSVEASLDHLVMFETKH